MLKKTNMLSNDQSMENINSFNSTNELNELKKENELNEEEITSYSSYSLFLDRLRLLKMEMENQHLEDNNSFLNELCNLECNSSYLDFTFKKGKYEE